MKYLNEKPKEPTKKGALIAYLVCLALGISFIYPIAISDSNCFHFFNRGGVEKACGEEYWRGAQVTALHILFWICITLAMWSKYKRAANPEEKQEH